MKNNSISELYTKDNENNDEVSWSMVQSQFHELNEEFNEYFPHLDPPKIIFEQSGISFHIKLHIFDTLIELTRSRRSECAALFHVIEIARKIVHDNVTELMNESDKMETTSSLLANIKSKKKKKKKKENKGADLLTPEELKELGIGSHAKQMNLCDTKIIPSKGDIIQIPSPKNEEENITRETENEKDKIREMDGNCDYYAMVKDYCMNKHLCYPEYIFEKTNGLFICTADFENETFTSKYAYKKEDSKEEVSKKIYEFIKDKMIIKTEHLKNASNPDKKESKTEDIQEQVVYTEQNNDKINLERAKNIFKRSKKE
ncbi:hypothetical protein H312_00173 [Anncaliia algerae PRA339]|uniref:Uncharacterized protein n=1 Tax=Anncaliia algerae PRA339 TaxID=1288291 RepID=A0A059F5N9_9MICR|nr:hypothetical protein H312_00173 [Anncaliia algerae PRA339]